jgi:hypothetical protein
LGGAFLSAIADLTNGIKHDIMKIDLQYPVFVFNKAGNMVYVYYSERQLKTVSMDFFASEVSLCNKIIDLSGMKYTVESAYVTGSSGFRGGQNGTVSFEYRYEDAGTPVTPETLKTMLLECYPKSKWLRPAWNNIKEFQGELDKCDDFNQLSSLFRRQSGNLVEQMKAVSFAQKSD